MRRSRAGVAGCAGASSTDTCGAAARGGAISWDNRTEGFLSVGSRPAKVRKDYSETFSEQNKNQSRTDGPCLLGFSYVRLAASHRQASPGAPCTFLLILVVRQWRFPVVAECW